MAKGIRVNLLAKELGVESKLILQKLKEEGQGDTAPNHMSVLSLGLAESVREWFSGHQPGGTPVENAPPVVLAAKPTSTRGHKKREETTAPSAAQTEVAEATPVAVPPPSVIVERSTAPVALEPRSGVYVPEVPAPVAPKAAPTDPPSALPPVMEPAVTIAPTTPRDSSTIQVSPLGHSIYKFVDCMSYWLGEQDEGTKDLVKKLIGHFESHLLDAKKAQATGNDQDLERYVHAALLTQFCILEGCILLLWDQYCYEQGDANQANDLKLKCLCRLASQKTGETEKVNFPYRKIRDGLLHARSHFLPSTMPSPAEVEKHARLMDEFLRRLDTVLE
jgi:hypothetical protein